ncbi:hypothetical protein BDP27DRAFT_1362264 [Rhodocollybia butyracea]|uniref:PH domain-containing protein n=1 Tax=Rhodocollybia butyracea TaxID=206335 RepID=A0A9P5PXB2_9AGAR|nr:hypothetical protein BDP27DRAFT_1362264 [Rhodocollybia butyracea]
MTERLSRAPSRATSIHSRTPSRAPSRATSLIRKQTAPISLRPSDILIERFTAWKAIVKQLISYFQGLADIQAHTAKELVKLGGVIQVPFRAGNQFLGEGGLQDVFYAMREEGVRAVGEEYAGFGRTIEGSIVRGLEKLRGEIKVHVKNIQNDTGKLATLVSRERELSTSLISTLATCISTFQNTPLALVSHPKSDPYIANLHVEHQLRKQVNAENLLQKSIIIAQANSAVFEEGIVSAIKGAWATYEEWRLSWEIRSIRSNSRMGFLFWPYRAFIGSRNTTKESSAIKYPAKEDASVKVVHEGLLGRKKRYTRRWVEANFVLTPAGFLHQMRNGDIDHDGEAPTPIFSLFLPLCTLGPPSSSSSYKFHIETTKEGSGTVKGGKSLAGVRRTLSLSSKKGNAGGSSTAWTFKARSREEMMEWWNDIRMLCARYLVASEQMERSGPVDAAVRAAGYPSEDEEDEEGEYDDTESEDGYVSPGPGQGSSVEEDKEFADADEEENPPGYSHGGRVMPGGVGENGFPLDKKSSHSRQNSKRSKHSTGKDPEVLVTRRPSASSSKSRLNHQEEDENQVDLEVERVDNGSEYPESGATVGNGNGSRFLEDI